MRGCLAASSSSSCTTHRRLQRVVHIRVAGACPPSSFHPVRSGTPVIGALFRPQSCSSSDRPALAERSIYTTLQRDNSLSPTTPPRHSHSSHLRSPLLQTHNHAHPCLPPSPMPGPLPSSPFVPGITKSTLSNPLNTSFTNLFLPLLPPTDGLPPAVAFHIPTSLSLPRWASQSLSVQGGHPSNASNSSPR